jgi:hypothetical protein
MRLELLLKSNSARSTASGCPDSPSFSAPPSRLHDQASTNGVLQDNRPKKKKDKRSTTLWGEEAPSLQTGRFGRPQGINPTLFLNAYQQWIKPPNRKRPLIDDIMRNNQYQTRKKKRHPIAPPIWA